MSIKAIFPAGVTAMTVNGLHQWDYGQALEIEAEGLPLLVEVHFACAGMKEAVVRVCQVADGKTSAIIPDACLEQRSPVVAWVYEIDEAGGKTILTVTMPVIARIKPPAGTSSPQVADQYAQLIALVNDQMDALFSGDAPVGRAFEADHAAEADHATSADSAAEAGIASEADHAAEADHATSADEAGHAASADSAADLDGVLPVEKGGTGADNAADALVNLGIGTTARIEQGSYVGTGTYGANSPNSLTFSFEPKFIYISGSSNLVDGLQAIIGSNEIKFVSGNSLARYSTMAGTTGNFSPCFVSIPVSWNENSVSWYYAGTGGQMDSSTESQMNMSGVTYHYVAIG